MNQTQCRYCQAAVLAVPLVNGGATEINPAPDPAGSIVLNAQGQARALSPEVLRLLAANQERYRAHVATCEKGRR